MSYLGVVGAGRFERPTPCAQGRCATRLRYAPTFAASLILNHFLNFRYRPVCTNRGYRAPTWKNVAKLVRSSRLPIQCDRLSTTVGKGSKIGSDFSTAFRGDLDQFL